MNKYRFFSSEAVLHILAWLFIFSMPLIFHHGQQQVSMRDYFLGLFMSLMLFVTFYTNYFVLAPCLFMKGRKKAFFILEIILLIVVVIIVQEVFTSYAPPIRHAGGLHHMHAGPARWMFVIRDFVTLSLSAAIGVAIRLSSSWHKAEDARKEAEIGKREAELKNLKNQINPHFLLNTLNNIYALTMFDTAKAQQAIQELSKLLRYLLYDNQKPLTSLKEETGFIESYIELMKMRTSDKVKIDVNINIPHDQDIQIAPLLFIPIVENAFKHGISLSRESFINIRIDARAEDGVVDFWCENSNFPKNSEQELSPGGIGLKNLHLRLSSIYKDHYHLQEGPSEDGLSYSTHLIIKTKN